MKLSATHKSLIGLLGIITATVLCLLPFKAVHPTTIFIYSEFNLPSSQELGLVRELKNLGYRIKLNAKELPPKGTVGLWLKSADVLNEIEKSEADFNFIYHKDYYPLNWYGHKKLPIILTPYQDLYEHYVRSNVKTALFTLGINTTDFHADTKERLYPLVYYGDNNRPSPLADYLKKQDKVLFLGDFWDNSVARLPQRIGNNQEKGQLLNQTQIVAIYTSPIPPLNKMITPELMQATAAGALVIANYNPIMQKIYGDSIVFYRDFNDFAQLTNYFIKNPDIRAKKAMDAQKITLKNFTVSASAKRLHELLTWLKN